MRRCRSTASSAAPPATAAPRRWQRRAPPHGAPAPSRCGSTPMWRPALPWRFEPETPAMDVRTGQTVTVFFKVRNMAPRDTAANAQYNITPRRRRLLLRQDRLFLLRRAAPRPGRDGRTPRGVLSRPQARGRPHDEGRRRPDAQLHVLRGEAEDRRAAVAACRTRDLLPRREADVKTRSDDRRFAPGPIRLRRTTLSRDGRRSASERADSKPCSPSDQHIAEGDPLRHLQFRYIYFFVISK